MQFIVHCFHGNTKKNLLDCLPSTEANMACKTKQNNVVDDKIWFWPWTSHENHVVKTKSSQMPKQVFVQKPWLWQFKMWCWISFEFFCVISHNYFYTSTQLRKICQPEFWGLQGSFYLNSKYQLSVKLGCFDFIGSRSRMAWLIPSRYVLVVH